MCEIAPKGMLTLFSDKQYDIGILLIIVFDGTVFFLYETEIKKCFDD